MRPQRFLPKRIVDIKKSDSRVFIMGNVVSVNENEFVVEDPSGRSSVFSDAPPKVGDLVRVFCILVDGQLKAEIVQSLNGLDLNLFQKTEELYRKAGL